MRTMILILVIAWNWNIQAIRAAQPRAAAAPEYAIKAVFLYNLVKYADWPPKSPLSDPAKPIVIAVIGEDPFGDTLDEAVHDRTIRGRPIVIVRASDLKSLTSVHVAFISSSESGRTEELVKGLAARSVLTVGDTDRTVGAGAAVNLVMVEGRLRFDINPSAVKRSSITLSSQLLKLARRVRDLEG